MSLGLWLGWSAASHDGWRCHHTLTESWRDCLFVLGVLARLVGCQPRWLEMSPHTSMRRSPPGALPPWTHTSFIEKRWPFTLQPWTAGGGHKNTRRPASAQRLLPQHVSVPGVAVLPSQHCSVECGSVSIHSAQSASSCNKFFEVCKPFA